LHRRPRAKPRAVGLAALPATVVKYANQHRRWMRQSGPRQADRAWQLGLLLCRAKRAGAGAHGIDHGTM